MKVRIYMHTCTQEKLTVVNFCVIQVDVLSSKNHLIN